MNQRTYPMIKMISQKHSSRHKYLINYIIVKIKIKKGVRKIQKGAQGFPTIEIFRHM